MAKINGFDTEVAYEDSGSGGGFKALPKGKYDVLISEEKIHTNDDGSFQAINLTSQIVSEKGKNRYVKIGMITISENEIAQRIGRGLFHSVRCAIGMPDLSDTEHFLNKIVRLSIGVKHNEDAHEQNAEAIADGIDPKEWPVRFVYGMPVDEEGNYNVIYSAEKSPMMNTSNATATNKAPTKKTPKWKKPATEKKEAQVEGQDSDNDEVPF